MTNGLYGTLRGRTVGDSGPVYGGASICQTDKMALCERHALTASHFIAETMQDGITLKRARPFKLWLYSPTIRPCEAC